MSNTTANCTFSSINDFLTQAEAGALNVTSTIENCPSICTLAWGEGNPDLSGIGANASYIVQAILIFLFNPVFILVYITLIKSDFRKEHLKQALDVFLDTNAQFTIPVSVAAIVRIKQHAPFYEITFLQSLMTMQFLGLLATIVTSAGIRFYDGGVRDTSPEAVDEAKVKFKAPRIIVITLYGLIDFSLYMGLVHHLRTSKASYLSLQQLAAACAKFGYGSLLPGFQYVQAPHPHGLSLPKVKDPNAIVSSWADDKTSFHNLGIIFGIMIAAIVVVVVICYFISAIAWFFGFVILTAIAVSPLAFSIAVIYCLVKLEQKRTIMKHITGTDFADNDWGFGQVVALFLWVPVLFQTIYWLIETDKEKTKESQSAESSGSDKTNSTDQAAQTEEAAGSADRVVETKSEGKNDDEITAEEVKSL